MVACCRDVMRYAVMPLTALSCSCRGSVVAIDAAEPRKELEPLHFPDEEVSGMLCHSHLSDMARFALHGDELGPSRHHPFDRQRYNYRPY